MNVPLKTFLVALMAFSLLTGFLHDLSADIGINFERLHVFLFNLCSGGYLIIYYTRERKSTISSTLFIAFSLAFTAGAVLELFPLAIASAIVLAVIVEIVRIRRFSFIPFDFFNPSRCAAEKFHHASLLCLSLALLFSALVMLMSEYLEMRLPPKMSIDIFFLGFSFPVSLITMSLMFSYIRRELNAMSRLLHELSFWTVNLGVILFFIFILIEWEIAQVIMSSVLFVSVIVIFLEFVRGAMDVQEKTFLSSGMLLLMMTAITGIGYIVARHFEVSGGDRWLSGLILSVHGYISLYGWNQAGMVVIMRYDDFPLKLNSALYIVFHWIIVTVLAPLGEILFPAGVAAAAVYTAHLGMAAFTKTAVVFRDSPGRAFSDHR